MILKARIRDIYLFLILVFLFLTDQFSKHLVRSGGSFYICNKNISFGIEVSESIFWVFWLTIIFLLAVNFYKKFLNFNPLYAIFIFAGSFSNAFDRLYFGCVTDFMNLKIWPVFNLADIFITIGAILIIFSILLIPRKL